MPEHEIAATAAKAVVEAEMISAKRANSINYMWEVTQAFLAVSLTGATIYSALSSDGIVPETLTNALFVVLGFYFGRTNHSRPTPTNPLGIV